MPILIARVIVFGAIGGAVGWCVGHVINAPARDLKKLEEAQARYKKIMERIPAR